MLFAARSAFLGGENLRRLELSSLYVMAPLPSVSSVAKTRSISASLAKKSKPIDLMARRNSFLSISPDLSSSHCLNRSITRFDERCSASQSE